MSNWSGRVLGILLVSLLAACGSGSPENRGLRGQILVWHSWTGAEEAALDQLFAQFMAIYPRVTIIHESKPLAGIGHEFLDEAIYGTGPDLLIAPAKWEQVLAEAGVIQDLSERAIDTSIYLPALVAQLYYQDRLVALPLSVHTYALYYNKALVSTPPATLSDLLAQAAEGHQVALETTFYGAFWGVQAFGGQRPVEALPGRQGDERGRLALAEEGLAAWLTWLKQAQMEPSFILSDNEETLFTLFSQGQVAYYVGGPDRLSALRQALGQDVVDVAPLPAGPDNPAGPFLQAEVMMFNAASTPLQTDLALELARFLTNAEQQTKLARLAGRVPANAQVKLDPRIAPAVAGFVAQTKTTVPVPNEPLVLEAIIDSDKVYLQTLEGLLTPAEAAEQLVEQMNSLYSLAEGGSADVQ